MEENFGEAVIEDIHLILAQGSHFWNTPKYLFTVYIFIFFWELYPKVKLMVTQKPIL